MLFKSDKASEGNSEFTIEKANKTVLVLFLLLLLLLFMDFQAARHSAAYSEKLEKATDVSTEALQPVIQPVRAGVDEIFGEGSNLPEIPALVPVATGKETAEEFFFLYFIRFRGERSELVRVRRARPESGISIYQVIESLQAGPAFQEKGLLNTFDKGIRIHQVDVQDGIAVVNVDGGIARMGSHIIQDRLDQLTATLTQFPEITGIRLLVDGHPVKSLGADAVPLPVVLRMGSRRVVDYN